MNFFKWAKSLFKPNREPSPGQNGQVLSYENGAPQWTTTFVDDLYESHGIIPVDRNIARNPSIGHIVQYSSSEEFQRIQSGIHAQMALIRQTQEQISVPRIFVNEAAEIPSLYGVHAALEPRLYETVHDEIVYTTAQPGYYAVNEQTHFFNEGEQIKINNSKVKKLNLPDWF